MDRKIEHKTIFNKKNKLRILIAGLIIGFTTLSLLWSNSSAYRVDKERLTIHEVINAPFQDYINVRGRVEPLQMTYLDAVEGGIVESILKEEGSLVKKGDTILVLSNLNLNLNILNSEAQLAEKSNFLRETQINMEQQKLTLERDLLQIEYDLLRAEREYDHNKGFYEEAHISKDEFLASKETFELAQKLKKLSEERQKQDASFRSTQIKKIKENLKSMERNLELIYQRQDHLIVKAPVDGQLAALNAVHGQAILPAYRLGQVNVLDRFKLQASIDEHYIDRVSIGLKAEMERKNQTYNLIVTKIYPEVNEGQFLVDLAFEGESPKNLRSGQTYNLSIQLGDTKPALLIERAPFFQSTGGRWVYVVDENGAFATKRNIKIGRQNPKYYELLDGLKDGDKVISSSYEAYNENEKLIFK